MMKNLFTLHVGLLIIRLFIGPLFVYHGFPKMIGGVLKWEQLGGAMAMMGIGFYPVFWGFMAAVSEFVGGIALALGLATRYACFFIACTMVVAFVFHIQRGDGFFKASHALELLGVTAGLFCTGAGSYSLDNLIRKIRS